MTQQPDDPVRFIEVQTEAQAHVIVAALSEEGIEAEVEGGLIASFRAEVPAAVGILVRRADVPRAREVVRKANLG